MGQVLRQLLLSQGSLLFFSGFALGILTMWLPGFLRRLLLRKKVEEAYEACRVFCEPEIVDPSSPGHPPAWASQARDKVNVLIARLQNAGFDPPSKCDRSNEKIEEWFEFLGEVRIKIAKRIF